MQIGNPQGNPQHYENIGRDKLPVIPTANPPAPVSPNLTVQVERVKELCEFILSKARNEDALKVAKECQQSNYSLITLQKIHYLELSGRELSDLPQELILLENLMNLNLCTNQFEKLPDWFNKLPNLRILVLNGNNFNEFPTVLLSCEKITDVCLASNKGLKELPIEAKNIISHPRPNYFRWVHLKK